MAVFHLNHIVLCLCIFISSYDNLPWLTTPSPPPRRSTRVANSDSDLIILESVLKLNVRPDIFAITAAQQQRLLGHQSRLSHTAPAFHAAIGILPSDLDIAPLLSLTSRLGCFPFFSFFFSSNVDIIFILYVCVCMYVSILFGTMYMDLWGQ